MPDHAIKKMLLFFGRTSVPRIATARNIQRTEDKKGVKSSA